MTEAELVSIILIAGAGALFLTSILEYMAEDHEGDE